MTIVIIIICLVPNTLCEENHNAADRPAGHGFELNRPSLSPANNGSMGANKILRRSY